MKKLMTLIVLFISFYAIAQEKEMIVSEGVTQIIEGTEYFDYYVSLDEQITYQEAKYFIEISRNEFKLNRAFFNVEKQYFIFETLQEIDKKRIKELFDVDVKVCIKVNPTEYINEIFEIRDSSIPHKISKFYIKK